MGRVFLIVLAVFLLLGAAYSPIADGIKNFRTSDTTQSFAVTTEAGQTTANVTLSGDLFRDDVTEVISITSNITGESPIATTYTAATNYLLCSALTASATHTLTVNYYADTEDSVVLAIGPFLGLLIFGGLIFVIFRGSKAV